MMKSSQDETALIDATKPTTTKCCCCWIFEYLVSIMNVEGVNSQ